jgi:hypothetical protein
VQFNKLCWLCGGYHLARIWHFALTLGYVFFFLIHIMQVILAGWNNFRSVVTGFEVLDIRPEPVTEAVAGPVIEPVTDPQMESVAEPPIQQEIKNDNCDEKIERGAADGKKDQT